MVLDLKEGATVEVKSKEQGWPLLRECLGENEALKAMLAELGYGQAEMKKIMVLYFQAANSLVLLVEIRMILFHLPSSICII